MPNSEKSQWWRTVLGEYPTGVVLITSLDSSGVPVGMVVGTFTAVSQDPPLVGFLPDVASSTFPVIAANGRFVANVLGAEHEALCRAFAQKSPDRFAHAAFVPTTTGIPRLVDAVAWFDVRIQHRNRYGDHEFVVGAVDDFGTGTADAGLPMLFRRAGYGVFGVPAEDVDAEILARRLSVSEEASDLLAALADELHQEIVVSTVIRDLGIVLSTVRPSNSPVQAGRRRVGETFPLAAPIAPLFVAWATPERQTAWIEGARHLVGSVDRPFFGEVLAEVRRQGFSVSAGSTLAERFDSVVGGSGPRRESFARLWEDLVAERAGVQPSDAGSEVRAAAVQAPVFGPTGEVELVLTVPTGSGPSDRATLSALAAAILAGADRLTERLGGTPMAREEAIVAGGR